VPGLSARSVARRCGVSHVAVLKAVRELRMPPLEAIADLHEAERLWSRQADPGKTFVAERDAARGRKVPDGALAKARLRRERAKAELAEMAAARMRGGLVDAERIMAGLAVQDLALKDRLMMVPSAAAHDALEASLTRGAAGIAEVYQRAIHHALSDLASAEVVSAVKG
jgi:hypothetical protein